MSQAVPCHFCREPGTSEEDVFAKWIADVVGGAGPFNLQRKHGRQKANLRYLGVTSRAACQTCNNGWMSRLEQAAKPLLTPIIQNRPARWSRDEQDVIARWTFKTALMYDRSNAPEFWTAPREHFAHLFDNDRLPPSVTVLLGHYLPRAEETPFSVWGGTAWASGKSSRTGSEFKGYRVTFSVGHAIFQTYGHISPQPELVLFERPVTMNGKPIDDVLRRLWPLPSETHEWPARGAHFDTSGLQMLEPGSP